jgi:hypothetical protein
MITGRDYSLHCYYLALRRTVRGYCVIDNELYRFDRDGKHLKVLYSNADLIV